MSAQRPTGGTAFARDADAGGAADDVLTARAVLASPDLAKAGVSPAGQPAPAVLPSVSPAERDALNAFYRPRPATAFSLAGRAATMTAAWPGTVDASLSWRIDLSVGDAAGALIVPRSLAEALIAGLDGEQQLDALPPVAAALLLELALADGLSALEQSLGSRLALNAAGPAAGASHALAGTLSLSVAIAVDDSAATSAGELRLAPPDAARLARLLDRHAAGAVPLLDLRVPAHLRVAATTCPLGEIASLSPGDIVMADDCCRQPRTAVAVVAEHLAAPVALTAAGAQFAARPERGRGSAWEWSMENTADGSQPDPMQKTDIDDIPVKLVFELGRVELSLSEVRQLAPGAVLTMPRPADDGVDILANGRRIGRGSLVQIGGNLGVRITRLFHYG